MSVVLWGPGERELAEEVVAAAGGAALLSPQTSIADLVALARGAAVMVSGDTGPTHIAAAVGTPIVGIYGPTRPERNGPWRPEDVTVSRGGDVRVPSPAPLQARRRCACSTSRSSEVLAAVERRLAAGRTRAWLMRQPLARLVAALARRRVPLGFVVGVAGALAGASRRGAIARGRRGRSPCAGRSAADLGRRTSATSRAK